MQYKKWCITLLYGNAITNIVFMRTLPYDIQMEYETGSILLSSFKKTLDIDRFIEKANVVHKVNLI